VEVCDEHLFGRGKTGSLGVVTEKKQEKPKDIRPRRFSSFRQGAKYITVTQDTSPSGVNF